MSFSAHPTPLKKRSVFERLQQLNGQPVKPGNVLPQKQNRPPLSTFKKYIEGSCVRAGDGQIFVAQSTLPMNTKHGNTSLDSWIRSDYQGLALAAKEERVHHFNPKKTVFMDTETTGLAGGTGTLAFLTGCLWLYQNALKIEQYFIPDYTDEPVALELLSAVLRDARYLVTFNGKSYDKELLETRFRLARMDSPFSHLVHIDLLHASRRIWKDDLPDCRLATLEEQILGVRRINDIPGSEIPQLYFDYLARPDPALIRGVFEHNRLDLLSMAALLAKLCALTETELDGIEPGPQYSLGRLYSERKDTARAIAQFRSALGREKNAQKRFVFRKALARCLKSAGQNREAFDQWKILVEESNQFDAEIIEELAKYYEHQTKEYSEALSIVEKALEKLRRSNGLDPAIANRLLRRFQHRKIRLECKRAVRLRDLKTKNPSQALR